MVIQDHKLRMPAAYLKVFLQHAASEHLPIESLLEGTALGPDPLAAGESSVSLDDTLLVVTRVTERLGPGWHLALARRLTVPSHGPLGFAVVTAPDVGSAVDVMIRFIGLRAPFLWVSGTPEEDGFVMRLHENTALGEQRGLLIELVLLSLQNLIQRPLGRRLRGARLTFGHPAPAYRERLAEAFQPDLSFDGDGHSLRLPAEWLAEPCALHDEPMHRYLISRCEDELQTTLGALPLEIAVRQSLLASPDRLPKLAEVAAGQHVSPRTLIRRLKRGNTSFSRIRDEVRKSLAMDLLRHSDLPVSRIAWRLGYRDPSNFGRAFRGWFGISPGRYRERGSTH